MTNKPKARQKITLKTEYKEKLNLLSAKLTYELKDRVTITEILYDLIDNYLDQTEENLRKKYNEEVF